VSALGYGQQAAGMGGLYERMATDPMSVQGYMSPYMQQVVERQKQAAIEDAQRANLGQNLGAVRQGTYGGARQALAQSQREASLEKQLGDIQAQGLQSAFDQARQAQQFGVTTGLQGLQTGLQGLGTAGQMGRSLADIASAQQQADVQRVGLQSEIGAQQQAREQGIIDQRIQDFALAEQYPFQQLSGYSGLLRGYSTPTTTINQYRAAQSPITQLAGTGIQLGGTAQALGVGGGRKAGGQIKSYAQGGITSVDALESMAEDLSIPQIQQSVKNKTLPGYVGIPILENKVNNAERIKMAQGIAPDMGQEPPIADQVMARADALQGIDSVATGAGGGMVAFERGGPVQYADGSQGYLVGALVQGARVAAPYVGRAVGRGYKALRDRTLGSTKAGILALPAGFLLGDDPEELYKIDDFPGMDLGETALADPAKQQGGANATKQGGPDALLLLLLLPNLLLLAPPAVKTLWRKNLAEPSCLHYERKSKKISLVKTHGLQKCKKLLPNKVKKGS
jgi:hypothetical protein